MVHNDDSTVLALYLTRFLLTVMFACVLVGYLYPHLLQNNDTVLSRGALYLSPTGLLSANSLELSWKLVMFTCSMHRCWAECLMNDEHYIMGDGHSYEDTRLNGIQGYVLAFILVHIHASIHRAEACHKNQDLWTSSCGNCVVASSIFPQSDSGNKSSMSNFLKFS